MDHPREPKLVAERDDKRPPGQFVSHEHEADCSRFLHEIKESIRRRSELGLDRQR
jgi:hypothetical protein